MLPHPDHHHHHLTKALQLVIRSLLNVAALLLVTTLVVLWVNYTGLDSITSLLKKSTQTGPAPEPIPVSASQNTKEEAGLWQAPDLSETEDPEVRYGHDLIANTSFYLGPAGKVAVMTNGMNCQNCHLDAGTKPYGNNYSAVSSTYPKFRARSGAVESIEKRVNDCMERSLNGRPLSEDSREMKAIVSYIRFLGKEVPKGEKPKGAGLTELAFSERAADPEKGKGIFLQKCQSCHGANGEGLTNQELKTYTYPPLWGDHSYNTGAGLFRLSRFAGYVKSNMPLGASYNNPQLTDEEAWDLAAFVNSQPRPKKDLSRDWPDISSKPVDHPFGPFADGFSEAQHKYGPFGPIKVAMASKGTKVK